MLGTVVPALAQNAVNPKVDELVAAIPGHFPPQYVLDDDGELTGFALDVAEQVGALADLRFRYLVEEDWVAAFDAVQSGRADILINNGITEERKLLFDFTEPVETFRVSLFVREDTQTIEGWDDLTGRKVAVGKLHVGAYMLADMGGIDLVLTDDVPETLFALLSGQADAMVYAEPVAWKVAREMGVDHRLRVVDTPLVEIKRAMSIPKGNPELLARLDRAIEAFVGSPKYREVYAKWYGRPEPFWSAARVMWIMGAVFAVSLATMVGWRQYSVLKLNRDLRQSEAGLAEAQRLAHVGNWRWSIERNELVSCSEEYARIYGVAPDEIHALMKQQMERVVHPEDRDRVVEAYRGADEEGLGFEIDYRIVRPDGQVRHVLEIGEAVSNTLGQAVEQVGTIQDITERKRAEEALRESLAHLRHAQKIAKLDYWVWDTKENRITVPGGQSSVIGASSDELRGLSDEVCVERYVHADDRQRVLEAYGPPSARNPAIDVEYRLVRPDGEVRIVHEVGESVLGENGEIVSQFGTFQDVTEQRAADERFRQYFDLPLVGSAIYAPDKKWIRVNDRLCELFGYSREELLEQTWVDLTHPDDFAENIRLFDEATARARDGYTMDKRFLRKDGEVLYGSISVQCVRRPNGDPNYFILLVQDITERKRAEEALRESLTYLRHAQRIAKLDHWIWDAKANALATPAGTPSVISDKTEDFFGLSDEEYVERFVHPEDRERVLEAYGPVSAKNTAVDVEYRIVRPDGEVRFVHEVGEPVFDHDGELARQFGTLQDITDRKRIEETLQEQLSYLRQAQKAAKLDNWVWDARDNKITLPAGGGAVLGTSPEEVFGLSDEEYVERFVHPEDRERVLEAYGPPSAKAPAVDVEYRIVTPEGEVRTVWEMGEPVFDETGELICQVGTLQDITDRKRAQEALRKSEASLANAQRIAHLGNWEWDAKSDDLFWSAETYRIFGLEPREFKKPVVGFLDLVHSGDRERVRQAWRRALEERIPYDIVHRVVRADGAVRFVHQQSEATYDDDGGPVSVAGTFQDITESKRAEEALRDSEERFRDFAETASDWFWEMDESLRFTYLSERSEEVMGVPIKEVIGLTRKELYDRHVTASEKNDREKWRAHYDLINDRQAYRNLEVTWCYPDGSERTFAHSGKPVFDEAGAFQGYRGTGVEITDRKKAEAALRHSEERLRGLFEQGAVGMANAAPDGRILRVNNAYCDFTGYAESKLIGKRLDLVIHPDDLREAIAHRQSVLDGKSVDAMHERRYRHKSGEERWGLAGVAPLRDPDGAVEGYIVQVQDITERKRIEGQIRKLNEELEQRVEARTAELSAAQEELVRKERLAALGQLTGTVSHELRNPLGAMRTSLAAIRKLARDGDPMLKRSVEIVDRSVTRCDNIIGDLLDYSRIRNLALEPTALDGWLERLLDEYQPPLGIRLHSDLDAGAELALDRDRLRQVVINLLDNACQAMTPEEGRAAGNGERLLTVATRVADARVELSVSDTGPGISPEEVDKVFEPLYSTKAFGVGLGLPLVRQIIEQHDGGIEVDRTAARGTRMVLWLPLEVEARRAAL